MSPAHLSHSRSNVSRRARHIAVTVLTSVATLLAMLAMARADEKPSPSGLKVTIDARRVEYFADQGLIVARGNVRVSLSNGVAVDGDACSVDLGLRRFVVAGHVHLTTPGASYAGAAFADFLPFHRAYFIPLTDVPDRWTFLNDDWAHPELGREMPGDTFFLADTQGTAPFIRATAVVIDPENYVSFSHVVFVAARGALATPPLPRYVRNYSQNPNFAVNSLSGASFDLPYGIAGSSAALDAVHFRYDPVLKTYFSFEHHSVFGGLGYAVFSLNPATQEPKQWNFLAYVPAGPAAALTFDSQLFTYQSGLSQPLSSNGFADIQYTKALRQSALKFEVAQSYDSLLAPTPLGYYGNPSHPFTPNHPLTAALSWAGYAQAVGSSGFTFRLLSGISTTHDAFGVSATTTHDAQSLYADALLSSPVYPGPFGTSLNGSYEERHVWLSFPNSADFQTAIVSDSKRFSKVFVTGSVLLQSADTQRLAELIASPNTSTGLVPEPLSPNGLPLLGGVATEFAHATNTALILTAADAPSPYFQFTLTALRNWYTPVQEPFVAGPAQYQAIADARMKISKTLFLDIGRAYYFNWANQVWSPTFSLQVSAQ